MRSLKYIYALLATILMFGCNDFLDENPSKTNSVVPETLEHLERLLNRYTSFSDEPAGDIIFGTDDYGMYTTFYDKYSRAYNISGVQYATWDKEYIQNSNNARYWSLEWQKIFTANLVLENIDKVSGDETTKEQVKAEAHFIKAYSYFGLAEVYCLPYAEATKTEPGLPIKRSTSFDESLQRVSLEETYNFIEDELSSALELQKTFDTYDGKKIIWRASTAAVNAFAARFYLALNDYSNAQNYAEKALLEYSYLRDYNTDMHYSTIPSQVTIFNPTAQNVNILYPYTHDLQSVPTDKFEWGEAYYYRVLVNSSWDYYPSQELLSLYDTNYDLRYKYHIVEDYSYDRGAINPAYSYPGYIFFFKSEILSGPTVPEMILIKGECQVRQGNWEEGLATVNVLRNKRMDVAAGPNVINLSASSQEEALLKVLEERRRDRPFVSRWYDVRRFNNNETAIDDVIMSKTFYPYNASTVIASEAPQTYTLDKNSRRFACPIPMTEIIASDGQIEQNTY